MPGLRDLFDRVRQDPSFLRAKHLARADYLLIRDLVQVRIDSGKSQEDIAELLGISQQAVSKIERYDSDPKLSTLRRYSNAVGALVVHVVEPDRGQLNRGEWVGRAFTVAPFEEVSAGHTYAAAGVTSAASYKRTDVALAS
jgi:transcriptional regulator with XRE-family HTH domain